MKTLYIFLPFLLCSGVDSFGVIGEKTEDFSEAEAGNSLPTILKREDDPRKSKKL